LVCYAIWVSSGLNNRNLFLPSSEGWKSKIRVPASLDSGESLLPGLQMATSHSKKASSLGSPTRATSRIPCVSMKVLPSWPHLTTVTSHSLQIPSHWSIELQHVNLGETKTFSV
jgi:hypothetical protein